MVGDKPQERWTPAGEQVTLQGMICSINKETKRQPIKNVCWLPNVRAKVNYEKNSRLIGLHIFSLSVINKLPRYDFV